jgi:flagellar FliL protein
MVDEVASDGTQGAGEKSSKLILIVLGALLVVGLAAGGGLFFLAADEEGVVSEEAAPKQIKREEAIYVKLRTVDGPSFISNFHETSSRQRMLQVFAEAMTRDEESAKALEKHMPKVVNDLSILFSNQSFKDLQTAEGKERLRQEATQIVQGVLSQETGKPGIDEVFFTNFVMQ